MICIQSVYIYIALQLLYFVTHESPAGRGLLNFLGDPPYLIWFDLIVDFGISLAGERMYLFPENAESSVNLFVPLSSNYKKLNRNTGGIFHRAFLGRTLVEIHMRREFIKVSPLGILLKSHNEFAHLLRGYKEDQKEWTRNCTSCRRMCVQQIHCNVLSVVSACKELSRRFFLQCKLKWSLYLTYSMSLIHQRDPWTMLQQLSEHQIYFYRLRLLTSASHCLNMRSVVVLLRKHIAKISNRFTVSANQSFLYVCWDQR